MQLNSSATKLGLAVISSSTLAAFILAVGGTSASAQLTIQSTGTLSGTLQLPSFNPNFNNRVTRIDTDASGAYSRNIGTRNNPNYVPVYQSDYVKVQTRTDGSLHYFVDFKGIPVISANGILNSPVLSGGELTSFNYQGKIPGTLFQGVVQDEFGLTRGFYTGVVTDPNTGQQYQGTFEVSGQGPRYSDRNGGESPTVFDFKSDLPGKPTVTTWEMNDSPLVRLTIKVPADATLVTAPAPVTAPISSTPAPAPVTAPISSTPAPAPVTAPISSTPAPAPVTPPISSTPAPTPVTAPISSTPAPTPVTAPISSNPAPTPVIAQVLTSQTPSIDTNEFNFSLPSITPNIEFSNGNSFAANPVGLETSAVDLGSCSQNSVNCPTRSTTLKQAIGPRSRVLMR
ncbi:hypothetical protein [Nostoc sp. CCY0012]|uniref:hypothetical protein n=1 Tax=Nostoc sp. CCY0012 TaxID=1056123 RepID=UPI0039C76323